MASDIESAAGLGVTAEEQTIPRVLVGISFEDTFRAREFMTAATRLDSKKLLVLEDAVLIVKDMEGKTTVTETKDLQPGQSALSGAMWAGLFGFMLGGPVGWVAGLAAGAGAGAVAAKVIDIGVSDDWVAWFRGAVAPGSATVVLLVSEIQEDALVEEARRFSGSHLVYANLDDRMIERLTDALGDRTGPDLRQDRTDS
jgi:uncharacterized membrane protein